MTERMDIHLTKITTDTEKFAEIAAVISGIHSSSIVYMTNTEKLNIISEILKQAPAVELCIECNKPRCFCFMNFHNNNTSSSSETETETEIDEEHHCSGIGCFECCHNDIINS